MKAAHIPLRPHSRFHFGELAAEEDNLALSTSSPYAHSDTLFSGLVHSYSRLTGDASAFVDAFLDKKIKISSLCYYLKGNGNVIHFLPKPIFLEAQSYKRNDGKHKQRNGIRYVSAGTWENGFEPELWFQEDQYQILHKQFVLTRKEYEELGIQGKEVFIASIHSTPKSPIRDHEAAIFYRADVEIGGSEQLQVGWYFLYEAEGQQEKDLLSALNVLAWTGIGGEVSHIGRTILNKPFVSSIDFIPPQAADGYANLSLFCPADQDDLSKVTYATTVLRGGRKFLHGGRAKAIRMIREGALFLDAEAKGRFVVLGQDAFDRPVYRNGVPFLVPLNYGT